MAEKREVLRTLHWQQLGVRVNGEYLSNFRFADDVDLLSNSADELQSMLNALDKSRSIVGLDINRQFNKELLNSLGRTAAV